MNTIGELERRAGIGPSHAERTAFWLPFAPLHDHAFSTAVAELKHRIAEKENAARGKDLDADQSRGQENMAYQIMIERIAGIETELFVLHDRFHEDAYVLADEMQRICQRAYTMGRMDEIEAAQMLIRDRRQAMVPRKKRKPQP